MVRKATMHDSERIVGIYSEARGTIAALGINQWQDGYPSLAVLTDDISCGCSFCVERDGDVVGTFALIDDGEPLYDRIFNGHWLSGDDYSGYVAMHRVAVAVSSRGGGVSGEIISYAEDHARSIGRTSLRIDTHEGNVVMRRMLEKNGFVHCGTIYLANGDPRVAYEKILDLA